MLRIVSANVNGIRSAAAKGFFRWLARQRAGAVGVQELRAQHDHVDGIYCSPGPLRGHFHYAARRGYAGVGLYTREEPSDVVMGFGVDEFDQEGRWVEKRFDRPGRRLSLISCYFPSGSSGEARQAAKFRFLEAMFPHLMRLKGERDFVLVGDVNIAHQPIDLRNWRGNRKNSGFLPEERAWMTRLLGEGGLVDVYRALHPDAGETAYTWWSNRGRAWEKNVGWRIDYQIATPALARAARRAAIYKARRFSDHAPLSIDYDFAI